MGRKSIDNIRKPQILEHFRQVVNKEGIHKASVVKIAKNMGVSPNLVLHYFDSNFFLNSPDVITGLFTLANFDEMTPWRKMA
jgi:hypothetical protein